MLFPLQIWRNRGCPLTIAMDRAHMLPYGPHVHASPHGDMQWIFTKPLDGVWVSCAHAPACQPFMEGRPGTTTRCCLSALNHSGGFGAVAALIPCIHPALRSILHWDMTSYPCPAHGAWFHALSLRTWVVYQRGTLWRCVSHTPNDALDPPLPAFWRIPRHKLQDYIEALSAHTCCTGHPGKTSLVPPQNKVTETFSKCTFDVYND